MKKVFASRILWFVLGFGLALGGAIAYYEGVFEPLPAALEKTYSIEITENVMGVKQILKIEKSSEIAHIVDAVSYIPKEACKCEHSDTIIFNSPKGQAKASICNHCLDFTFEGVTENYKMTERLLNQLKQAVKNDPRQWAISSWQIER